MSGYDSERYAKTLSDMIKIATISRGDNIPTDNIDEFRRYTERRFPKLYAAAENIDLFDGGLMLKWKGRNPELKPLVLMSHSDVVSADDQNWKKPAFSGEISGGKIYGRGAADTKASLCAFLEAAEKLAGEGFNPVTDVYFLSSSREEVAGKDAKLMAEYFAERKITPALVMDEGGAILNRPMPFIRGTYAMIAMSELSSVRFLIEGSREKAAAFKKAVNRAKLTKNSFPPEVEEMFRRMTPDMTQPMKTVFKCFKLTKGLLVKVIPKVSKQGGAMLAPSINFSDEKGKTYLKISCNYYHDVTAVEVKIKELAEKYSVSAKTEYLRVAPKPTDFENPGVKFAERIVTETFDNVKCVPFIIFGGTDARHFCEISDCVVRFAPVVMNYEIINSTHKADEYVFQNSVLKAVEYYVDLITNWGK